MTTAKPHAPISVGILGLGEVSQLMHLPILHDMAEDFRITGLFDVSASAMAYIAARYPGTQRFDSAEALCLSDEIDAVFILTPDNTHHGFLEAALDAGKHVFLEKPACLTTAELDSVMPMAKASNKVVFVGYMRRYSRPFQRAKQIMPNLSKIRTVRVRDLIAEAPFFIRQSRPVYAANDIDPAIIAQGRRETDTLLSQVTGADAEPGAKRAYQVLTGLSIHSLSAMRELIGLPKRVISANWRHGGESIVVLFDYGHFVAIYEAMIDNNARFEAVINVLTDRTEIQVTYDTPYIRNLPTELRVTTSTDDDIETTHYGPDYTDPFRIEIAAFKEHIRTGSTPKTTLQDAREDMVLLADIARAFCAR